jgi:hypothetical protein
MFRWSAKKTNNTDRAGMVSSKAWYANQLYV